MNSRNRYFFSGILTATIGVAALFSITGVQAYNNRLKPEINFARQIGIYDSTSYNQKMLGRPMAELAFYRGLSSVLYELDLIDTISPEELSRRGIAVIKSDSGTISRRTAAETIFRALTHALEIGYLKPATANTMLQPFHDWVIEEKYMTGLSEAINRGIIRGMPNGKFYPDKPLKTADALVLFKRFFDSSKQPESSDNDTSMKSQQQDETSAAINKENREPMLFNLSLERLNKAGAFSGFKEDLQLHTKKSLKLHEARTMLQGILKKADKPAFISELKFLTRNMNHNRPMSRTTLAEFGSILVRAFPGHQNDTKILYADVAPDSRVARALTFLGRVGVRLGYENNLFKGNEVVTPYETVKLFDRVLENAEQMQIDTSIAATRSDFVSFKTMLESRRARIKRILYRQ